MPQRWVTGSHSPLLQSGLAQHAPQEATVPTAVQVQTLAVRSQILPEQSTFELQPSAQIPASVLQLPVAHWEAVVQVAQRAPDPVGAAQLQAPVATLQVPPGQSLLATHPLAHTPDGQLFEMHWAEAVQLAQANSRGGVQPQVLGPPPPLGLQAKPPQSALEKHPSVQTPAPVSQLPVAQSDEEPQAPHSGTVPGAVQLQTANPTSQKEPGHSALVLHPCVHSPAKLQIPLRQSEPCPQAWHRAAPAVVPHSHTKLEQADPLQSAGFVQNDPFGSLQCWVLSQFPLWQSLSWVQVAQMGAVGGGLQSQVWLPNPPLQMAPAGQSASLLQDSVQVWLLRSQSWLMQSALVLQAPHTSEGQAQWPPVQVVPLQSAAVVQRLWHCDVAVSQ